MLRHAQQLQIFVFDRIVAREDLRLQFDGLHFILEVLREQPQEFALLDARQFLLGFLERAESCKLL